MATMMVTTYLETRYVDRAKLNELLQALFGQNYSVVASGDTISVEASRELTEAEKNSVSRNK
ncbi:uncharacterized protein F4817DRAFT_344178 [Daldinia loculata]|uniref:uncharacterized protein n=1 Tax=Daldinia loculata TaxID=103429 RepID=UPI0020C4D9D0|nr:uncharacterized protein F4817DRAFT_344178 [Daldinia loculata]KAI1645251.1 hypothetical protein F4817DRAFT_344178 [Daldinia loculata]